MGIRQLPIGDIEPQLASGALDPVLPAWHLPVGGIFAVWPDSGPQKALTRRLIDFFTDRRATLMP